MVILNSMNYSPISSEIGNKNIKSDAQGLDYIKKYNTITDKNKHIEGFSNLYVENSVSLKNKSEVDNLLKLQSEYQKKLSDYSQTYNLLMSNVNQYFELRKSPLLNKNIRLSDGKIGYVTSEGVFKHYPSMEIFNNTAGKNNCPTEFIQVEANIVDGKVTTTPPFIVGEPMQSGQSCGHEGKNVFAANPGTPGPHTYKGCFRVPTSSNDLQYQEGLGEAATFDTCKQLANDTGNSVFALVGNTLDKLKCYVGSNIDSIRANGDSLTNVISWETPNNVDSVYATLNNAGQLILKGNITTTAKSNLTQGLSFKVYKGYMNDDVNFFKSGWREQKAKLVKPDIIASGVSNNFSSLSSSTNNISDQNSTYISVEWLGYLKCNVDCDVAIAITSDDCSYMWLGNNAISEYSTKNAFINNGGQHPSVTKTNSMTLKSNEYYPVRIQFGQNAGVNSFRLYINSNIENSNVQFLTTPNPFASNLIRPDDKITTIGDLWTSSGQVGGCDPSYGGKINLDNSTATWGANCNSIKSPNGSPYNIQLGNSTEYIKTALKNSNGISFDYIIGKKDFNNDPAVGCPKNFSTNYKCGNGPDKQIFIDGEANARFANFNCVEENKNCQFLLNVQDDGNLVIYSYGNETKPVWNSNTFNKIGVPNPYKNMSKGKYGRNFLLPGETLEDGEFIGSQNGKCFLTMIKGRGLILMYSKSNCENIDGKFYGTNSLPNSVTAASYVISESDVSNLYETGYVDSNSILRPYDSKLLKKSNNYTEIGNFRLDGTSMKTISTNDVNKCKIECSSDPNCDGFTFGNNMCDLRSSQSMYPSVNRYSDTNSLLYKRLDNVINNGSCSKTVVPVSVNQYSGYIQGKEMTQNAICGLGIYNKEYYTKLRNDLRSLQKIVNKINYRLTKLSTTDKKILAEQGLTENKIKRDIVSINNMQNKITGFKPQYETTKGMVINTEDEMISSSYYNMLWSILAIMIVIGGIKMAK